MVPVQHSRDFYPRSPCGERLQAAQLMEADTGISIHALLAESDHINSRADNVKRHISIHALLAESDRCERGPGIPDFDFYPRSPCGERPQDLIAKELALAFLSTLSLRRATNNVLPAYAACGISIHALLAESDGAAVIAFLSGSIFLSTLSLRRATAVCSDHHKRRLRFLSTLSLRRATTHPVTVFIRVIISIHALLAESD